MKRTYCRQVVIFSLLCVWGLAACQARGAALYWTGAASTDWNTAGNWESNAVPASGDTIYVGKNGKTLTNNLVLGSGAAVTTGAFYSSGGQTTLDGATLTVNGRWRVGGDAAHAGTAPVVTLKDATLNFGNGSDYGFTIGYQTTAKLNIEGNSKVIVPNGFFNIHGQASNTVASEINMSGGQVRVSTASFLIGEAGLGHYNLTGGTVYTTKDVQLGCSTGGKKGVANGSGHLFVGTEAKTGSGEMYITGTLMSCYDAISTKSALHLNSGLISIGKMNMYDDLGTGSAELKGGTFLAKEVTGSLTNAGSTIELASDFAVTWEKVDGLAEGETFFTKYQQGKVGNMAVSGTFAQTAGTVRFDIASDTSFDTLTASQFNVTGGTLTVTYAGTAPAGEKGYKVFGAAPSGTLQFTAFKENDVLSSRWLISDGQLIRRGKDTMNWNGSAGSSWNDVSNWTGAVILAPDAYDTLQIGSEYQSYTSTLTVAEGDNVSANLIYLNGGEMTMTGGKVTMGGRTRIGSVAGKSGTLSILGGTWTCNGEGFGVGANDKGVLNIGGTARVDVAGVMYLHGDAELNLSGGRLLTQEVVQFGEYAEKTSTVNITGGAMYNLWKTMYVGRNANTDNSGHGIINIGTQAGDDGQLYIGTEVVLGRKDSGDGGHIVLTDGILSAKKITLTNRGSVTLNGGTFLAQTVAGDLTNSGSRIEAANDFDLTVAKVNGLAEGETFFSKYQENQVGTLTVSGMFAQTDGTLVIDIASSDSYDKINAASFNVTGGQLYLNVLGDEPVSGASYDIFSTTGTAFGTLDFAQIVSNIGDSHQWRLAADGSMTYFSADSVPEPASWLLAALGALGLLVWRRKA